MTTPESVGHFLRAGEQGVLATLATGPIAGYPFASAVPFCLDRAGRPLLLISRLARHTRHVQADSRVSLFIQGEGADVQAAPRLTLAGQLQPVPPGEQEDAACRYIRYFPQADGYHTGLDFEYWRLEPVGAHFVAGFARVAWLEGAELLTANPFDAPTEADMIDHMNRDHADALPWYLRQAGVVPAEGQPVSLIGVDSYGFHLRTGGRIVYIPFPRPVRTPLEVRQTLVELLKSARAGVNPP